MADGLMAATTKKSTCIESYLQSTLDHYRLSFSTDHNELSTISLPKDAFVKQGKACRSDLFGAPEHFHLVRMQRMPAIPHSSDLS